ncbi:MAG: allophanate hydrolase [Actinobacteria bacterium]|nr:allophanate hydrolase [Actinomycetota bacterium]
MNSRTAIDEALDRIAAGPAEVWIDRRADAAIAAECVDADGPLAGRLLAVKGNIDVAGFRTTAGCPAYGEVAARHAPVVERLEAAGMTVVGTTNMDQFATGLVGTRTPHGALTSVLAPELIAGGSSSGSAVAVASGLVDVALGTDTAGSGRVPAAMNGIVGFKPTQSIATRLGVVPACRSLDCVSVFARDLDTAWTALGAMADPGAHPCTADPRVIARPRVGVPRRDQLQWFGDVEAATLFDEALERLVALGATLVPIDLEPFLAMARLLYEGPWVAERDAAVGDFIRANPDAVDPVVREVILGAAGVDGAAVFRGLAERDRLLIEAEAEWATMDVLALPTTPVAPTLVETLADPHGTHARLGTYTNFVNLMGLCAVSVPAGVRPSGGPFGLQLIAPAHGDALLFEVARRFDLADPDRTILLAVVGAHLSGLPLNHQLTRRGARLHRRTTTAPRYRLHRLPEDDPPKPALVRVPEGGTRIEVEVWTLDAAAFGSFTALVPPPLAIGSVELADGAVVKGFVCEEWAVRGTRDISAAGGWRAHLSER